MQTNLFYRESRSDKPNLHATKVLRSETVIESSSGTHTVIVLDADDTFDVIVHHPNGERECVWSLIKGPEL